MVMILAVSVRRAAGGVLVRVGEGSRLMHVASARWGDSDTPDAIARLVAGAGDEPIETAVASAADDDVREDLCATIRELLPIDPLGTTPKATRRAVVGHAQAVDGEVDEVLLARIDELAAVESATLRDALLAVIWAQQQRRARELRG